MSTLLPERDALTFQCKDILSRDVFVDPPAEGDEGYEEEPPGPKVRGKLSYRRFQIQLFGLDAAGRSICLQVDNFRPFFYVRIPDCLAKHATALRNLKVWILNGVPEDAVPMTDLDVETHKTLMGFNDGFLATFLKITVPSQALWRALKDKLLDKGSKPIPYETTSLFGIGAISVLQTSPSGSDTAFVAVTGDRIFAIVRSPRMPPTPSISRGAG